MYPTDPFTTGASISVARRFWNTWSSTNSWNCEKANRVIQAHWSDVGNEVKIAAFGGRTSDSLFVAWVTVRILPYADYCKVWSCLATRERGTFVHPGQLRTRQQQKDDHRHPPADVVSMRSWQAKALSFFCCCCCCHCCTYMSSCSHQHPLHAPAKLFTIPATWNSTTGVSGLCNVGYCEALRYRYVKRLVGIVAVVVSG